MYGHVRGVLGDPGTCKTLFLAYMAFESYSNKNQVTANFTLKFPYRLMRFDQIGQWTTRAECGCQVQPREKCEHGKSPILEDNDIFMTELGRGADSYHFLSKKNNDIADLVFQGRKLGARIWYDAQRWGTVTKRIRDLTNYFFLMDNVKANPEFVMAHSELIGNELDKPIQKLITGEYIIKGIADVTVTDDAFTPIRKFRFDGRKYYGLYLTEEMIWV
jgi:hypothetical protein